MVIVGGSFELDPDQREEFLAGRLDSIRASRAEPGCLEYTMSADPLDPSRVVLFERWADQGALDTHLAAMQSAPRPAPGGVAPKAATITVYDISGERPLA